MRINKIFALTIAFLMCFLSLSACVQSDNAPIGGELDALRRTAYELAVENGFSGTEKEWLESLNGKDGKDGANGLSAYEIAVSNGFVGTEKEWLESLKGESPGMKIVTYSDYYGENILGTETVVFGSLATKYKNIGEEKDGYEKVWLDKNGDIFDFSGAITENTDLRLKYRLYGRGEISSPEVLALTKTPCKIQTAPNIDEKYYKNYVYFAMQAGMEVTDGGRIWSVWIAGEDGPAAYMVATYSDDNGETWKDLQLVIDPHSNDLPLIMNVHCGHVWKDPLGRLWIFYQQSYGMWDGEGANFAIICDDPDADVPVWHEPMYISPGASLKKPIIRANGEWILPVSIWERWHISQPLADSNHELDGLRGAHVYASTDNGKTWQYRGGLTFTDSQFNEHSVVELSDGRLMMYSRCSSCIKKSYSSDGGRTWSQEEVAFPHIGSLAVLRKLPNGHLLLVKHGQSFTSATTARSHLCAFISKDDGETWEGGLLLDERTGVSYPEIALAPDGTIWVQYDYERARYAEIIQARFTEEEVLAGSISNANSSLKRTVKDTYGIKGHSLQYGTVATFRFGTGTQANPYLVENADQLRYIAMVVAQGNTLDGKYFAQTNDIDFDGENIIPIGFWLQGGSKVFPFRGNYDGQGHEIKNFTQNAPELYSRGLFGYMTAGSVKNVKAVDAFINGKTNTGAIVGNANGSASDPILIENCGVYGDSSVIAYTQLGGIVGRCLNNVTIKNCVNNATVYAPYSSEGQEVNIGGIVGYMDNNVSVINCVNNGTVRARHAMNTYIGGISSNGKNCTVTDCTNNGNIFVDCCAGNVCAGGISGWSSSVTTSGCKNRGDITVSALSSIYAGGIIGFFGKDDGTNSVMYMCTNGGNVNVKAFDQSGEIFIGGIAGRASSKNDSASSVKKCVSIGTQTFVSDGAKAFTGGFVGCFAGKSMAFEGNFIAYGSTVGKAVQVSMDEAYTYCVSHTEIALQKYDEYQ